MAAVASDPTQLATALDALSVLEQASPEVLEQLHDRVLDLLHKIEHDEHEHVMGVLASADVAASLGVEVNTDVKASAASRNESRSHSGVHLPDFIHHHDKQEVAPPPPRNYSWNLKTTDATVFRLQKKSNGQIAIMLRHPVIRGGVTSDMLFWWFQHFPNLKVHLHNVPGWENNVVPAYLLWHPIDHIGATLGHDGAWEAGDKLRIREMMQYDVYGPKYYVNDEMQLNHLLPGSGGGQSMGKTIPLLGQMINTRIQWKDVEGGVAYHYEIVIGQPNPNFAQRFIVSKIAGKFTEEFLGAWNRHNVIEVGVFENFLPALYAQRETLVGADGKPNFSVVLNYDANTMDSAKDLPQQTEAYEADKAEARWAQILLAEDSIQDMNNVDIWAT